MILLYIKMSVAKTGKTIDLFRHPKVILQAMDHVITRKILIISSDTVKLLPYVINSAAIYI
ncbi:hypothetical protein AB204_15595 [Xenorhabdus khoisanae]|uniref:Uncharacterized protein n=1 Tax=Xenorhabdus khoisanae TaxID=880157 RepID=A0A0J5FQG6_9GAMM|nr:hypothetical protein AB204_15595 [Xenorhabdus khoisanae]